MSTSSNRTAGTIEAWNLILKRSDHPKHRKRPDLFLKEHYSIHFGRQLAYIDNVSTKDRQRLKVKYIICLYIQNIYTCIQKQLDKPKTKLLEEKWSKRSKKPGQNLMVTTKSLQRRILYCCKHRNIFRDNFQFSHLGPNMMKLAIQNHLKCPSNQSQMTNNIYTNTYYNLLQGRL